MNGVRRRGGRPSAARCGGGGNPRRSGLRSAGANRAALGRPPRIKNPLSIHTFPDHLTLAAGLPVVASDLPPMRDVDPRVALVGSGDGYAAAVEAALARGRAGENERIAFIAEHSWRARHDRLLDLALA